MIKVTKVLVTERYNIYRPISQKMKSKSNDASLGKKTDHMPTDRSSYNGKTGQPPLVIITADTQNEDTQKGEKRKNCKINL